jgi:hypothetical protein
LPLLESKAIPELTNIIQRISNCQDNFLTGIDTYPVLKDVRTEAVGSCKKYEKTIAKGSQIFWFLE